MIDRNDQTKPLNISRADLPTVPKMVSWEAPANIALIKYWGKKGNQIPVSPSLSMTLSAARTNMEVHYTKAKNTQGNISFRFNGEENSSFENRINQFIAAIMDDFPFLNDLDLLIYSHNTFPHSAGIASSASALSALALCICSIEEELRNEEAKGIKFLQKASNAARLGSGSAARSVFGGYVEWGARTAGTDEYAAPFDGAVSGDLKFLHDSILITSSRSKKVSSTKGHALMENHPYREGRIHQALTNFHRLKQALINGDFNAYSKVVENEALSLHALMLSSNPGFILLHEDSLQIIEKIKAFRQNTGSSVTFTLDAGPNVHLLYPTGEKESIRDWINTELRSFCENGRIIHDFTGKGPERLDKNVHV